jgi:hypothetical protein
MRAHRGSQGTQATRTQELLVPSFRFLGLRLAKPLGKVARGQTKDARRVSGFLATLRLVPESLDAHRHSSARVVAHGFILARHQRIGALDAALGGAYVGWPTDGEGGLCARPRAVV